VNYRNSKLTYLLKDSLGGNSKTTIITCITPSSSNFKETINSLQFADRAKQIKNTAMINCIEEHKRDEKIRIKELEEENRRLKLENLKFKETVDQSQFNDEEDDEHINYDHNVLSNIRAMNEVDLPTNVNSDCRSPGFQISADRQEKNKELSVLKGILK